MGLEDCPVAWEELGLWEVLLAHEDVCVALEKQFVSPFSQEQRYVPISGKMSASLLSGLGSLRECLVLFFSDYDACHSKSFRFRNGYILASLNRHEWKSEILGTGTPIHINFGLVRLFSAVARWPFIARAAGWPASQNA
jgi:hypothetical protein